MSGKTVVLVLNRPGGEDPVPNKNGGTCQTPVYLTMKVQVESLLVSKQKEKEKTKLDLS